VRFLDTHQSRIFEQLRRIEGQGKLASERREWITAYIQESNKERKDQLEAISDRIAGEFVEVYKTLHAVQEQAIITGEHLENGQARIIMTIDDVEFRFVRTKIIRFLDHQKRRVVFVYQSIKQWFRRKK